MLNDLTQNILSRAMDVSAMRNRAMANNLANVETPGFHRQDVAFEDQLRSALDTSTINDSIRNESIDAAQPNLVNDNLQPERENGNNVDVDKEMAGLAENTIHYQAILQSYNMKDGMLRTAIYEGKK